MTTGVLFVDKSLGLCLTFCAQIRAFLMRCEELHFILVRQVSGSVFFSKSEVWLASLFKHYFKDSEEGYP